ncbi:hypothetical protein [Streptomyces sp. NBC_01500]|uniref:hypothetical protein n=1 Tax=Streptomyces sp. NBC_01500 TaxID=2903886 RepID=UPI0022562590|nr:hypothetical protein [Streptomyces sp. NBC_01500]MCX4554263.1 hypothetical protein [Streptomyces sp. NBC_01500]
MSELARVGSDGAGNGFQAKQAKLAVLQQAAAALREEAEAIKNRMRSNSKMSTILAEMCRQAEVHATHTSRIDEIAAQFGKVAGGGLRIAAIGDRLYQAAHNWKRTHATQYGGIYNKNAVSRVPMAKPGFYRQR